MAGGVLFGTATVAAQRADDAFGEQDSPRQKPIILARPTARHKGTGGRPWVDLGVKPLPPTHRVDSGFG